MGKGCWQSWPTPAIGNSPVWCMDQHIIPLSIVARKHDHPLMDRIIRFLRERGGNTMIPKQGGLKAILTQLKKNQIVGMAIDQNTTTKGGILVDFFGHRARTTPIAAILARRFGTPGITGAFPAPA